MRLPRALAGAAMLSLVSPMPVQAQPGLQQQVEARLREVGPGTRFGMVVMDENGRELIAIDPDGRYIPASNTKIVTTAAAFATLPGLDAPDAAGGTAVRLDETGRGAPDAVLVGHGDARMSSAADCATDCLATLADAVAARTRTVHEVVGDDSLFPDQRWSPGMSWNNIPLRSGTAVSALTLDDNVLPMMVTPARIGAAPTVEVLPYYTLDNRAVTTTAGETALQVSRGLYGRVVRLTGTIAAGSEPERLRLSIDDPAHYAAWRLKALLEARGVRVTGAAQVRHRPASSADDPKLRKGTPPARASEPHPLARLVPPPLAEDLTRTSKVSQNLHAELLLRRLGLQHGTGSIEDGLAVLREVLAQAGLPPSAYAFSDGSGMSTYNRISARGMAQLLRWVAAQPWGAAWRATLPVAGVDGTLARRFKGTSLEGQLFAKTGTLNASDALAGYLTTRSGKTLIFAAYANDVPDGVDATALVDAALVMIAEAN